METVKINVSGAALSFMIYENIMAKYNQEGFLLGQVAEKQKKSITDNDKPQVHTERSITFNSVVPCPKINYFYDSAGIIDKDAINTLLQTQNSKVVGWYKFKKGYDLSWDLTLRERLIHKQLACAFDTAPELFVFCQLAVKSNDLYSLHSYKQRFSRYNCLRFIPVPLHIINLNDPNTMYKSSAQSSETLKNVVASLNIDFTKTKGVEAVTKIQQALEEHLKTLVVSLSESETKMHTLQTEVQKLEKKLAKKLKKKEANGRGDDIKEKVEKTEKKDKNNKKSEPKTDKN